MSSKYGSSSGDGGDAFKNTTPASMSQKLNEPKKKRKDSHKKEEHTLVSQEIHITPNVVYACTLRLIFIPEKENAEQKFSKGVSRTSRTEAAGARV